MIQRFLFIAILQTVHFLYAQENQSPIIDSVGLYYDFEGDTDTIITDRSGNGISAQNNNAKSVNGLLNQGLEFNENAKNYCFVGDHEILKSNNFTIMAWVMPYSYGTDPKRIEIMEKTASFWMNIRSGNAATGEKGILRCGGMFWEKENQGDDGEWLLIDSPTAVPLNKWTHTVFTYEGERITSYINGIKMNSKEVPPFIAKNDYPLIIGSKQNKAGSFEALFNGILDEIYFIQKALSETEIKQYLDDCIIFDVFSDSILLSAAENSSAYVHLESNINWTANVDSDWLRIGPNSGGEGSKIKIQASENTSEESRSATITFTSITGYERNVLVIQDADIELATQNNINSEEIKIYPIPAKDYLIIESNNFEYSEMFAKITSISGSTVYFKKLVNNKNIIDLSKYNLQGLYILQLTDEQSGFIFQTKKIIIK